jgi:hypothetical protein
MTRKIRRHDVHEFLVVLVLSCGSVALGACEQNETRPPDERIDAPEADVDNDGGDGVQRTPENPGSRVDENAGAPEDGA